MEEKTGTAWLNSQPQPTMLDDLLYRLRSESASYNTLAAKLSTPAGEGVAELAELLDRAAKALEAQRKKLGEVREFCAQRQIPEMDFTIRAVCASVLNIIEPGSVKYTQVS
jgi:hypothetical protein